MKRVVSSDMVAHLWAHKSQSSARNGKSSMFFEGDTIYSYGWHFPMARHFKDVVLINDASYSLTTSKHQSITRQAVNHLTCIYVIDMVNDKDAIPKNFKYFARKIDEAMQSSLRAHSLRWKDFHLSQADNLCANANAYSKLMKRKRKFSLPDMEAVKLAIKKAKERAKVLKLKLIKDNAKKMIDWENGEDVSLPLGLPVCLRLQGRTNDINGPIGPSMMRTSKGAEFPLSHGKRIYEFAKKCRETKTAYQHNGHTIRAGSFRIDSISVSGNVEAGCHHVTFETIERFAKRVEW